MENELITNEKATAAANKSVTLLEQANIVEVKDADTMGQAEAVLVTVRTMQKELITLRKSMTQPLDASKRAIMDFFREPGARLTQAETRIKAQIGSYVQKVEREAAKAQAEADERARKERERLEARAEKAQDKGQHERAEAIQGHADAVAAPIVAPAVVQSATTTRTTWRAEVTDLKALLEAVLAGTVPETVISANMPVLNKMATALKEGFNYPGVKAVASKSIVNKR